MIKTKTGLYIVIFATSQSDKRPSEFSIYEQFLNHYEYYAWRSLGQYITLGPLRGDKVSKGRPIFNKHGRPFSGMGDLGLTVRPERLVRVES